MIELRWNVDGKLQYRTLIPSWHASGAWGEPSTWTKWTDVPERQAVQEVVGPDTRPKGTP